MGVFVVNVPAIVPIIGSVGTARAQFAGTVTAF
jgi:hypothetical protein